MFDGSDSTPPCKAVAEKYQVAGCMLVNVTEMLVPELMLVIELTAPDTKLVPAYTR